MAEKTGRMTMMKRISTLMILGAAMVYGACTVTPTGPAAVHWEAYKTPAKAGVKGAFTGVRAEGLEAASGVAVLLEGATVTITASSVDSKNPERDAKLAAFFFGKMAGEEITARVTAVSGDDTTGTADVAITMNGVTRTVPMRYSVGDEGVKATGYVDLADFSALAALASINKACYDLHAGKTWQDVAVSFVLPVRTDCR